VVQRPRWAAPLATESGSYLDSLKRDRERTAQNSAASFTNDSDVKAAVDACQDIGTYPKELTFIAQFCGNEL